MCDEKTNSVKKIAIVTSHPIQYQAPLFRAIARQPDIDLTVFFGSNHGIIPDKVDPGFGKAFAWDVSLLDGYKHIFQQQQTWPGGQRLAS